MFPVRPTQSRFRCSREPEFSAKDAVGPDGTERDPIVWDKVRTDLALWHRMLRALSCAWTPNRPGCPNSGWGCPNNAVPLEILPPDLVQDRHRGGRRPSEERSTAASRSAPLTIRSGYRDHDGWSRPGSGRSGRRNRSRSICPTSARTIGQRERCSKSISSGRSSITENHVAVKLQPRRAVTRSAYPTKTTFPVSSFSRSSSIPSIRVRSATPAAGRRSGV